MDMGRNAYDAQSTRQKTSAVSDETDTLLLCTARDETNNLENCPCVPLPLDLQNEGKEIKVNSSRQILRNLTSNCELAKLKDENNALKQRRRNVEDGYDSLKLEAKSIQDENESLMTALKLLNNEINGKESKHIKEQNLHDEETPWVTGSDNKTMPRNNKRERQLPVSLLHSLPRRRF